MKVIYKTDSGQEFKDKDKALYRKLAETDSEMKALLSELDSLN